MAAGIKPFANRPAYAQGLPSELASHTGDHQDLDRFSGARVLVVGGGQSALESAALLNELGAEAEVVARADHLNWLHGGKYQRKLGRLAPLVYAPTDVGPMGLSRLVAVPDLFRRLPRRIQDPLAYRSIRPAGAAWLTPRLQNVPITMAPVHRVGRAQPAKVSRSGSPTAGSEPSTTSCWAPVTGLTSPATRSSHRAARRACAGLTATRCSGAEWSRRSRDCISSAPRPRGASGRSCASCRAAGTPAARWPRREQASARQADSVRAYRDGHDRRQSSDHRTA